MSKHENPANPGNPVNPDRPVRATDAHGNPVATDTHGNPVNPARATDARGNPINPGVHGAPAANDKSVSGVAADLTALDKKIAELKATPGALDVKGAEALVEAQKASATLRDKLNPPNKPTLSELSAPTKALNHQLQIMPPTLNAEAKKALDVIQAAAVALQGKVGG